MPFFSRIVEPWYAAFAVANSVMGISFVLVPLKLDRILNQGPAELGILSTLASAAAVFGSLMWGRLSDVVHRRKAFVVISYFAVGLAHIGLAFTSSFHGLAIYNSIVSLFWIANASVAVLLVIERTEEHTWESHISALNLTGALGWLLGLVLGGIGITATLNLLSERGGLQTLFVVLAILAFVSSGLAAWLIPVTTKPLFTKRKFRGVRLAVGNLLVEGWRFNPLHLYHRFSLRRLMSLRRETRTFLLASALAFTGIGFFAVPLMLLLSQRLGYSPSGVFFSLVMLHSGIVLAYPVALHRIKRRGNRRVQIGSLGIRMLLFAAAAGALATSPAVPWVITALFLFLIGITWSFFQLSGVALASRLAKPENKGLALGTYNAIAGASTTLAGISSGYLAQLVGYHLTYAIAAVLLLNSILVLSKLSEADITRSSEIVAINAVDKPTRDEAHDRALLGGDNESY